MSDLAQALVIDYVDLGLAVKETNTSVRSLDGKSLIEFEPDGVSANGEIEGLKVFINGDWFETFTYNDPEFNTKLIKAISVPLNF